MKILDSTTFDALSSHAKQNPRLRKNLNLHGSYEEPSQRLLNAMEPSSYIRPHRHLIDPKPECFIGIRGRMALLIFDDFGNIECIFPFGPSEEVVGVDLPPRIWHTVVCLETNSIFFETKPGPFNPINKKDMASWAPEEGSLEAGPYLDELKLAVFEMAKLSRGRKESSRGISVFCENEECVNCGKKVPMVAFGASDLSEGCRQEKCFGPGSKNEGTRSS